MIPNLCEEEIARLASFLLKRYPNELGRIGKAESIVDVAIRLLGLPVVNKRCICGEPWPLRNYIVQNLSDGTIRNYCGRCGRPLRELGEVNEASNVQGESS